MHLPPALKNAWHTHGYYGSVSHNVKAIDQRYMGWFDGNPADLWPHTSVKAARRYVEFMGAPTPWWLRPADRSTPATSARWCRLQWRRR
jgi:alkyl sulfatase BDS1-like metallo-beta-lactamase superfamily hydrolase